MALAVLASEYAKRTGVDVTAFTVDHGLREGSPETARQCADWCSALGLRTRILTWDETKPSTGLQAAARKARYRLLAQACSKEGSDALLTAHSADDQAETVFMRLRRGSGTTGLAAMSGATRIAGGAGPAIRLLRPLLGVTRAQLTETVKKVGQAYFDDPANDDPTFERVRVRALLAALGEQDLLTNAALIRSAERLSAAESRLRQEEDRLFSKIGGYFYRWGGASVDRLEDSSTMGALAARLIHAVSGEDYRPDPQDSSAAMRGADETGAATLGGALIKRWKGRFWFVREPAALLGRSGVAPVSRHDVNEPTLWDGRFILRPLKSGKTLSIGPVGRDIDALRAKKALFDGPDEGLMSAPALYCDKGLISAAGASFGKRDDFRLEALTQERFKGEIIRF